MWNDVYFHDQAPLPLVEYWHIYLAENLWIPQELVCSDPLKSIQSALQI